MHLIKSFKVWLLFSLFYNGEVKFCGVQKSYKELVCSFGRIPTEEPFDYVILVVCSVTAQPAFPFSSTSYATHQPHFWSSLSSPESFLIHLPHIIIQHLEDSEVSLQIQSTLMAYPF